VSEHLVTENIGPAIIIRFTRPNVRNPLSRRVVEDLLAIVGDVSSDASVERVVFTGTGEAFASGANLNEIAALTADDAPDFARLGQSLMQKIADLRQFTVAAINGHCFGGALDLALACKSRIAFAAATFAHPGAGLGIITGWGGTQRLPRLVGQANACEMFFTASPIDTQRALHIGLIDQIAEDVVARAFELSR
jgi:enoyl-CoA hydratase